MKKYDFVGVGDMVTDAFIELEDAWIEDDNPEHKKELCMRFGDKLPYKDVVVVPGVGNAINAAVCVARLGVSSSVVSDIGDDRNGKESLLALADEKVGTDFVNIHKDKKSNYNYVLRFKEERTILVHHNEYDYVFPKKLLAPKFLYLSSLAKNSVPYHKQILSYLNEHPETKLVFQPGTFQIKLGKDELRDLYKKSYVFFCNKEESQKIIGQNSEDIKFLLQAMHDIGPQIVVITDGPNGAYVYDGRDMWHGPMYPDPKPPVDRTGAGDSFSATFVAALILGFDIETALKWGPINSMSNVQEVGSRSGLLDRKGIEEWLAKAPADYTPKKI